MRRIKKSPCGPCDSVFVRPMHIVGDTCGFSGTSVYRSLNDGGSGSRGDCEIYSAGADGFAGGDAYL